MCKSNQSAATKPSLLTKKRLSFVFPMNHKIVQDCKIVNEHMGDLQIEGVATIDLNADLLVLPENRCVIDIDYIRWNGVDVKPVVDFAGLTEDIKKAAINECRKFFVGRADWLKQSINLVRDMVGDTYLYFDEPAIIKPTPHSFPTAIWGATVSPEGVLHVMDADQAWYPVSDTSDAEVIASVYQHLKNVQAQRGKEVAA